MNNLTADVLGWQFYGNTVQAWIAAGITATVVFCIGLLLKWVIVRHLTRLASGSQVDLDAVVGETFTRTRAWFLVLVALWAGSLALALPGRMERAVSMLAIFALLIQIVIWANAALGSWTRGYESRNLETDAASVTTVRAMVFLARLVLWTVVMLVALDNLGINITALIAGLGVGGIAVALAVQNILGDLFASLSIVLDKPFVVGDFIIVGELVGTVEYIGLKTTRLRSLSGEQLVFSNSDLLNSRIRNFKRMQQRRIVFEFGVVYQTPPEQVEEIPGIVREIITGREDARFDRAHFKQFGDFSLDFEVVYNVLSSDFGVYMDIQQHINLELYRRFQERGIEFAYPTQTVYLERPEPPAPTAV